MKTKAGISYWIIVTFRYDNNMYHFLLVSPFKGLNGAYYT